MDPWDVNERKFRRNIWILFSNFNSATIPYINQKDGKKKKKKKKKLAHNNI